MFKTGSKNSKQSYPRDGTVKNKNNTFSEYDIPKVSGKMSDKCFPSKAKNKLKISPIVNACSEQVGSNGASPIGLNVCFGKKLLRSPSNSQTLEFNDRSTEGREEPGDESRVGGEREEGRSVAAPRAHGSVYGRLGNTYGRLQVLGSGIGRIERHLSSSCGNIDHYCTPPLRSSEGNPRFRIENQSVEADRIYQHVENAVEEAPGAVPAPGTPGPPGIKGISKGSLQWLMVNRWLPLWVANTGGKNEYKVIDLDFSIYDDVRYPMCTAACTDEHCSGRSADAYSLYRRNCLAGGHLSLGRERDRWRDSDPQNYHSGPRDNGTSPGSSDHFNAESLANDDNAPNASGNAECDSPEPDSSAACSSGENYLVGQDSVGENDQDLSTGDNEQSVSECTAGEASSTSESSSPAVDSSPLSQPMLAPQTNHPA